MATTKATYTIGCAAGSNFFSSFNPAFFCSFAALLLHQVHPVFDKLGYDVLLIYALFSLPLLFTGIPEHYLTTRYSCRNVIAFARASEFLTMLAGTAVIWLAPTVSHPLPLLIIVLLMGVEYAMYRPALKCYSAEMIRKSALPWASAATEGTTFFGISLGGMLALATFTLVQEYHGPLWPAGLLAAACSFYSLILASRLNPDLPLRHDLKFRDLPRAWLDSLRKQPRYRELVLTGIGESYVFGSMILVAAMTVHYIGTQFTDLPGSQLQLYLLMPSAVLGCMAGCLIGGWRCKENVEIGLVPPATTAMALLSFLVGTLPYYADVYIESGLLFLLLAGIGFFAGIILVPMQTYQEYFVRKELRPAFFAWFYLPFGVGLLCAMGLSFLMFYYDIPIFRVTLALAVISFALAAVTFVMMPQFLLRMLMKMLLSTLYRLRIFGKEHIPEDGPALLVSNRASFVDMFFISACTTRPVRFMMHESFFRNRFMRPLYKAAGFLEVPSAKPKKLRRLLEKTRAALSNGEIVCVFPEGDITRNGTMSEFKDGLSSLLPENLEVPVIPLRIGMTWGSIFSCYYGEFKFRWPNELPHPASVTIGKPIQKGTTAYELRVILTELGAETEMVAGPQERPFHAQFAFIAKRFPLRRLVWEYGTDYTHSILNLKLLVHAIVFSRKLRKISDESTEYIGMMLPNGIASVMSLLAIQYADRAPAVLNYTASKAAMQEAIRKTGLKHIITSRAFVEKLHFEPLPEMIFLEDILPKHMSLRRKLIWTVAALTLNTRNLMKLASPASWQDVNRCAVVIFSSGSTGIPKGIMLSHHNINGDVSSVINIIGWNRKDAILGNLPVFHSFGMNVCLWLPLSTGCRTIMIPNPLDALTVGRALRKQKITVAMATPSFLQTYMRRCSAEDFKTLRLVVTGAEKLRGDIAEKFRKMTGLMIAEGYGCTELSPIVSINLANSLMELGAVVAKPGCIGPALPGVCAKIVDPATFELMPENTDGLLIVRGAIVMMGYLGEPEKTAEVIRDGWYITGDIAKMDRNGFISITGRFSRFTKIAGEMVPHELVEREINNILLPDERIIAVSGGEDPRRGEKLVVFYTDRERVKPEELVRKLREANIPNLWIPKAENFVWIEQIPQLGSGKLDLAALSEKARIFCMNGKV